MRSIIFIPALIILSCSSQNSRNGSAGSAFDTGHFNPGKESLADIKTYSYHWTKLVDSAPWKKSYNFQMFSFRDTLWTFHPDGNWFSTDGISWTKSSLPNAINNHAFLDYILFKEVMYGLGHFEGNIEHFSLRPEIYFSGNMKRWDSVHAKSNLPERFFYHPFIFNKLIWIIGGEDKNTKYTDIWNSPDGIHWTRQKDHADCAKNGGSQVLVSADGKHWEGMDAPWSPRGGIAATVHNGKIYMTGGKYGGTPNMPDFRYNNDVWVLEKRSGQ